MPAYAREHGLEPDTLYRWRRFLPSAAEPDTATPGLGPISVKVEPVCEVVFPDVRQLRFPATLPAATLRAWVGGRRLGGVVIPLPATRPLYAAIDPVDFRRSFLRRAHRHRPRAASASTPSAAPSSSSSTATAFAANSSSTMARDS